MQTLVVAGGDGTTTVQLPKPPLPWLGDDVSIKVSTEPLFFDTAGDSQQSGDSGSSETGGDDSPNLDKPPTPSAVAMVALRPKRWFLFCTRDGYGDGRTVWNHGFPNTYYLEVSSAGPLQGWAGIHALVAARSFASMDPLLSQYRSVQAPLEGELRQFVSLSHYFGDKPPKVEFHPDPDFADVQDGVDGRLELHLEIKSGVVVAVTAWDSKEILDGNVGLKPFGLGFNINVPDNDEQLDKQHIWQFTAKSNRDQDWVDNFRDKMGCPDPPLWDPFHPDSPWQNPPEYNDDGSPK